VLHMTCSQPDTSPLNTSRWIGTTETTRIKIYKTGKATFDDMEIGQTIKYACKDEADQLIAKSIMIYPEP